MRNLGSGMRVRVLRRTVATVAVAVAVFGTPLTASATVSTAAGGTPAEPTAAPMANDQIARSAAAADTPPHTVEDFAYPGADQILAERGITLLAGDGSITLADCGPPGLIEIQSSAQGRICFRAVDGRWGRFPSDGYLTMQIPDVYLIKGDDHTADATLTADNQTTVYPLERNAWTPVGEGADPENPPAVLLEIRTYWR